MKRILLFAFAATLASLVSCQKENVEPKDSDSVYPEFTATIDSKDSKTTVNVSDGKVSWESTDEITVSDDTNSAVYKIKSIDGSGKATFEVKDNTQPVLTGSSFTATYGTAPSTSQTYSATAGKLYMTAPATATKSFTFTVQCGLMKLNLNKSSESVKTIIVTGTPTGGSETTYTLTCETAQSIATATDFYVALPAGDYNKIEIYNSKSHLCILNASSGVTISTNTIKPVTIGASKINFTLPGLFSVTTTKKVRFSPGNLQAVYNSSSKSYTWQFAQHQYDYIGNKAGNTTIGNQTNGAVVDLFGWSTSATNYGINTSEDARDYSGNFKDWGATMGSGWRTLSSTEWNNLCGWGSGAGNRTQTNRFAKAMVNGVKGFLIFPDGYNGTTEVTGVTGIATVNATYASFPTSSIPAATWTTMEAAGCVFIPAAGYRDGSIVSSAGSSGDYWSSTPYGKSDAYYICFGSFAVVVDYVYRYSGQSVRLVRE